MRKHLWAALALSALAAGCATTRVTTAGWTPGGAPLVTTVTSSERAVVLEHCRVAAVILEVSGGDPSAIRGCQLSRVARDGWTVYKVVRHAEAPPSERDAMIEAHEWCHVVEALRRLLGEPCHARGEGDLTAALLARRTRRTRRRPEEDDEEIWKPIEGGRAQ